MILPHTPLPHSALTRIASFLLAVGLPILVGCGSREPGTAELALPPASALPPPGPERVRRVIDDDVFLIAFMRRPMPVAEAYRLAIDDRVHVAVFGRPDLSDDHTVLPDGRITVHLLGPVPAAGRTVEELSADLTRRYDAQLNDPHVDVILEDAGVAAERFHRDLVAATGGDRLEAQVINGRVRLPLVGTLAVGGLDAEAAIDRIVAAYQEAVPALEVHPSLRDGAEPDWCAVLGEVNRSGRVPLQDAGMPLMAALADAGGLTDDADEDEILLVRRHGSDHVAVTVIDVGAGLDGDDPIPWTIQLQHGDIVYVPRTGMAAFSAWMGDHLWRVIPINLGVGATYLLNGTEQ